MDMHSKSGLLVTLSDTGGEAVAQEISLWDISSMNECKNLITVPIPAGDLQVCDRKPYFTLMLVHYAHAREIIEEEAYCRFVLHSIMPTPRSSLPMGNVGHSSGNRAYRRLQHSSTTLHPFLVQTSSKRLACSQFPLLSLAPHRQ
jgi:hypothetical protein